MNPRLPLVFPYIPTILSPYSSFSDFQGSPSQPLAGLIEVATTLSYYIVTSPLLSINSIPLSPVSLWNLHLISMIWMSGLILSKMCWFCGLSVSAITGLWIPFESVNLTAEHTPTLVPVFQISSLVRLGILFLGNVASRSNKVGHSKSTLSITSPKGLSLTNSPSESCGGPARAKPGTSRLISDCFYDSSISSILSCVACTSPCELPIWSSQY